MNSLFICDTPYQVLNVLNIAFHQRLSAIRSHKTLFLINQFETAVDLYENIAKENLFDEIYLLTRDETKFLKIGMERNVRMAIDFLNPKAFLKKRLENYNSDTIISKKYDEVYGSGAFSTVVAILKLNPQAKFIMYDDGLGSYSGNYIIRSSGGRINRAFCRAFHVGSDVCKPALLLVNNPPFCKSTVVDTSRIVRLPDLDDPFIAFCNNIFDVNVDQASSMYWLTQPIDANEGRAEARRIVKEKLEEYRDKLIVRFHPRDVDYSFYSSFKTESSKDLWELSILNKNVDNLVLISEYSSAQMTPKMLFNIEPTLVFLYKLNNGFSSTQLNEMESKINDLKEIYSDSGKILVPDDSDSFEAILSNIFK